MLQVATFNAPRLGQAASPAALLAASTVLAACNGRQSRGISLGLQPPASADEHAPLERGLLLQQVQSCQVRPFHGSAASWGSTWSKRGYHSSAAALLSKAEGQGQDPRQALQQAAAAAQQMVGWGRRDFAERALKEGIAAGAAALGKDALELAPLLGQLATLAYVEDRVEAARGPAQRAYEIYVQHEGRGSPGSALAAVRHAVVLLASGLPAEALEVLTGTQQALKAAMGEALSSLPLGDEVFAALREGGQEALQRMKPEEVQRLMAALAARRTAEVCEVGMGESIYYETLAKLSAQRPIDAAAVEGAGTYLCFGLEVIQANSSQELHRPVLDFALREHHRLLEQALAAGDSTATELLRAQHEQLCTLCGGSDP